MKPRDFKRWRKSLGLSQKDAAERLGLKRRVVQYYEKGERDGKDVGIPKAVRLACYALTEGVSDYHGPREADRAAEPAIRLLSNGHDDEHAEEAGPEPRNDHTAHAEDGKKQGKRRKDKDKEKEKDKGREKGKGKGKERGPVVVVAPDKTQH